MTSLNSEGVYGETAREAVGTVVLRGVGNRRPNFLFCLAIFSRAC